MVTYILIGIISGILFGFMDGLINANPLAQRLYEAYQPIAKTEIDIRAGIVIDLAYGLVMAGIFLILYDSLPGDAGVVKGLTYGVMVWFFRVVMRVASDWMMVNLPREAHLYTLAAGLGEMLVICLLYGLTLTP